MNTVAWPSPVIVVVRSVPHIASTVSGMMVPSWLRGPRGEPTRVGASSPCTRISRSTRRLEVRSPAWRSLAQTFLCPSPWKGLAARTPRIAASRALVHGGGRAGSGGPFRSASGDADGDRLGGADHAVEHPDSDGGLAPLGGQTACAGLRSDDRLEAPGRGLREAAAAVAGRPPPGHAAFPGYEPDAAIAPAP